MGKPVYLNPKFRNIEYPSKAHEAQGILHGLTKQEYHLIRTVTENLLNDEKSSLVRMTREITNQLGLANIPHPRRTQLKTQLVIYLNQKYSKNEN